MSQRPKRMIFDLDDDTRLLLEGVRIRLNLRTYAETIRALIGYAAKGEVPPGFEHVPLSTVAERKPSPAPGPAAKPLKRPAIKSRLKGEWKAP